MRMAGLRFIMSMTLLVSALLQEFRVMHCKRRPRGDNYREPSAGGFT